MVRRTSWISCSAALLVLIISACGGGSAAGSSAEKSTVTLYTCASENIEQAVITSFQNAHPGTTVQPFRAATGQLNARVAADVRTGGIQADVIWACDPLTMHGYDDQGLLKSWTPANAPDIPSAYRTSTFTGIAQLYMVVVVHRGMTPPTSWSDLTKPEFKDQVAVPSPTFAASALGALGYFASAPGYGLGYYAKLKANGAVQLSSPTDTLTGVEQGKYQAGLTLANAAYADQKKGSPIEVIWPQPGGIAIYGPIAVTTKKSLSPMAEPFANFAASAAGQQAMAAQGTYVTLPGIAGPPVPAGSAIAAPNWPGLFGTSTKLLTDYTAIFGS